jgi:predicted TIM-barrel fold metal-dependent hydrolase
MIIDTHVHIWEIDPPKYPVGPTAPNFTSLPDEPATAAELIEDMDANGVDRTVAVQTSWSTWDNGYIADSAQQYPDRIIGHGMIDPQDPENADKVRYWMQGRGLVGFRFHPFYYAAEKILLNPKNGPLWEEIAMREAVIQFHLKPEDADQVDSIARRFPHNFLLLDHMGYPDLDQGPAYFRPILELARHPRIIVKLSDIAGRSKEPFPYTDVHPYIRSLVDAFGAERCMWGTGYPGHHRVKHNWLPLDQELRLIREGLPFLKADQIDCILGTTAARVWQLT